ncbi:DUF2254 domain-containing protein [Arthrobacter antibioticus]|uniref:DUF2254 domain-containing protein n=1 Tax=Arthrobacter sp. H35-MC1 TaxID=3046203 RepID=UPI0024B9574B|nr:DUF2254 domain-containing protein [Arthrobacter sp. H35-MC1]MDJ0316090.1 DUF2254 domain-containing protein [Arthrobacter sp. H35-MC1]
MPSSKTSSTTPAQRRRPKTSPGGSSVFGSGRLASLVDSVRTQLWPVPVAAIIVAVIAGQFLPYLDKEVQNNLQPMISAWIFGGGPDAASNLLQTIAGAMVTVTALTFSLTVVTLQLASSQFSPRLLRTFTRDRVVHSTLALFLATFAFSLTLLRSIRTSTDLSEGFVPKISVTVAFLLAVASVLALVGFLSHLARQIRVESMLKTVYDETVTSLGRVFPEDEEPDTLASKTALESGAGFRPIESGASGFLLTVDGAAVCAGAAEAGAVVVFQSTPGDSLIQGVPCARARSAGGGRLDEEAFVALSDAVQASMGIGFERTSVQDATLGLQQLLDIASRALSPGINDATTAVHAIGHVSALLCGLADCSTGPYLVRDDDENPRVLMKRPTLSHMLDIAMRQLLQYAMDDPRSAERTIIMLRELAWVDTAEELDETLKIQSRLAAQALRNSDLSEAETERILAIMNADYPGV